MQTPPTPPALMPAVCAGAAVAAVFMPWLSWETHVPGAVGLPFIHIPAAQTVTVTGLGGIWTIGGVVVPLWAIALAGAAAGGLESLRASVQPRIPLALPWWLAVFSLLPSVLLACAGSDDARIGLGLLVMIVSTGIVAFLCCRRWFAERAARHVAAMTAAHATRVATRSHRPPPRPPSMSPLPPSPRPERGTP